MPGEERDGEGQAPEAAAPDAEPEGAPLEPIGEPSAAEAGDQAPVKPAGEGAAAAPVDEPMPDVEGEEGAGTEEAAAKAANERGCAEPAAAGKGAGDKVGRLRSPSHGDRSRDRKRDTKHLSRTRSRDRRSRRSHSQDRRRSRSRSRDRLRRRSRSRSRDRRRRSRSPRREKVVVERAPVYEIERVKPGDRAPVPIMPMAPMMPGMGGMPNMPNMPNMPTMPTMASLAAQMAPVATMVPAMPMQPQLAQLNQLTRPARRLYVGGLPQPCYDFMLTTFLNQALMALGICQVQGKAPIIACQVTPERNFAFIEFSDTSDATAALQLDGIPFPGNTLKIKRPKDYTPTFGAPPDPTPLGPMIMAQLLANNSITDGTAGAAAVAAVPLPSGGLPLPGAGFPGAVAALGGMPGMPGT